MVIISSDSTCDLSPELIEKYSVKIKPLYVVSDERSYVDGVDITAREVLEYQKKTGKLLKTSAPNVAELEEMFDEYGAENEVVHFSISSAMSSTYQNTVIASEGKNVYWIDSQNLSTGIGLMVLKACDLRDKGKSAKEIAEYIEDMKKRVDASFVLDTLEYLHKGGRCSAVAALGANLLKLKPCIEVKNGSMGVGKKYRGQLEKCITAYINDRLADADTIENGRIFVTHTCDDAHMQMVDDAISLTKQLMPDCEVLTTTAGCTVSVHCGPNTLGVLFVRKNEIV